MAFHRILCDANPVSPCGLPQISLEDNTRNGMEQKHLNRMLHTLHLLHLKHSTCAHLKHHTTSTMMKRHAEYPLPDRVFFRNRPPVPQAHLPGPNAERSFPGSYTRALIVSNHRIEVIPPRIPGVCNAPNENKTRQIYEIACLGNS